MSKSSISIWLQQIRAPFLILSIVLVLIGVAAAEREGFFSWGKTFLLIIGVMLAHVSVNLFNELSDFKTKIDEFTHRTPFSGGSGMLQKGSTTPGAVSVVAYTSMVLSGFIGLYFCLVSSWYILIFMVLGGIAVRFYTSHLAKWLLGEFFSGLTLGSFVVLGSFLALTGSLSVNIIIISIPPGVLTCLLLFLNEFPDAEADKKGGRYHLIIHFGKKKSARIYVSGLALTYIFILLTPFVLSIPYTVLIALITLPIALKASITTLKYYADNKRLLPALAMNVAVVILTDLLLAVGFFL
jgi:1,4-dihydroxy-2-naphthoate octaprenyltransferase